MARGSSTVAKREKKTEGLHDNWKEMNMGSDGISVRDRDGTVTRYKNREDMQKGTFKEITFPRKKR